MPELLADLYTLDQLQETLFKAIKKKENYHYAEHFLENNQKSDDQISFCVLISECIKEWGLKFAHTDGPILQFYKSTYEKCLMEGVEFKNIRYQLVNKIQNSAENDTLKDGINELSGK